MEDRDNILKFKSLIQELIKAYRREIVEITEKKIGPLNRLIEFLSEEFPEPKSEADLLRERLAIAKANQDAINSAVLKSVDRYEYLAGDDNCPLRIANDAYLVLRNSTYAHFKRASLSHPNVPQVISEWIVSEMFPDGALRINSNGRVVRATKEPTQ